MTDITQFPDLGARLTHKIIEAAIEVHKYFGPGLLESIYEEALAVEMKSMGLNFERQKPIPVEYKGLKIDTVFRADFIVENEVILELKAVEKILPIHEAQILSYMKLSGMKLGLIMNFNSVLIKDGIKRMALGAK
ncbi:MAG: GxxExxY protein [Alphaproteobacteria bacterium]|nr:GxxExxY protein [Alphaproteobacteria bacterium]QQS58623.1 MAG: GxxExxY protein [Alphaproteobacteria bacterium]